MKLLSKLLGNVVYADLDNADTQIVKPRTTITVDKKKYRIVDVVDVEKLQNINPAAAVEAVAIYEATHILVVEPVVKTACKTTARSILEAALILTEDDPTLSKEENEKPSGSTAPTPAKIDKTKTADKKEADADTSDDESQEEPADEADNDQEEKEDSTDESDDSEETDTSSDSENDEEDAEEGGGEDTGDDAEEDAEEGGGEDTGDDAEEDAEEGGGEEDTGDDAEEGDDDSSADSTVEPLNIPEGIKRSKILRSIEVNYSHLVKLSQSLNDLKPTVSSDLKTWSEIDRLISVINNLAEKSRDITTGRIKYSYIQLRLIQGAYVKIFDSIREYIQKLQGKIDKLQDVEK
jgi:hypothetical protein